MAVEMRAALMRSTPGGPALKRMKFLAGLQHIAQRRRDPRQVGLASFGEADASGGSIEEPDAESSLQVTNRLTECRG